MKNEMQFAKGLENLINRYSMENGSDTPDFILAGFLVNCLRQFNQAVTEREQWYGRKTTTPERQEMVECGGCERQIPRDANPCPECGCEFPTPARRG